MVATAPHYLLLTETQSCNENLELGGFWRFVLQQVDGTEHLDVSDTEPGVNGERLQLLAAIRGLEAIGQPSRVNLVTSSAYVNRGIRRDLASWRESNWTWDRFGELHDIKHRSLWQRLDRAMQFHSIQCRSWRMNAFQSPRAIAANSNQRFRRLGRNVLDSWVQTARKMRHRNTIESLTAQCS
ncbi:MAG: hypothetical protein P8J33_12220 [Pirellulaceae bacterium]|nr:hypothetical protein [Pirellulaceae bacterium]